MSVEVIESGKGTWPIVEAMDKIQLNPIRIGRYVAIFKMNKKKVNKLKSRVSISMKLECRTKSVLLNKDKRTISVLLKLSVDPGFSLKCYKVTDFMRYVKLFDGNITKAQMNLKNMTFAIEFRLSKEGGYDKQNIEYDQKLYYYLENLFNDVLVNGDIKMFYQVVNDENNSNNSNKRSVRKKRKLNNGQNSLIVPEDDNARNNYVRMNKWLLAAQSDYFKTYLKQKNFKDSGSVEFCGYKVELLAFIKFVITGVVPVDVNAIRLCVIAGIYGVDRLQEALVVRIVSGLTVNNFCATMNALIKSDKIEIQDVYREIIRFGVDKYNTLKCVNGWRTMNVMVRNAIIMMYQNQNSK